MIAHLDLRVAQRMRKLTLCRRGLLAALLGLQVAHKRCQKVLPSGG